MKEYRRVTIKRKLPFYHEQQEDLRDWFSDANTAIGAFWEKGGGSKQGSGMSREEENLIMPHVLSIESNDRDFRRAVSKYFRDINTNIPQEGKTLVVSLQDDDEELSEENMPVDKVEYVMYRHAAAHPFTAESEALANANPLKKFFIEDPQEIVAAKKTELDKVDVALQDYFEVKKNAKKVEMLLTLLGEPVEEGEDPVITLKAAAEKKPKAFHSIANDEDMKLKYEIKMMAGAGVLDIVKGKYLRTDNNETIGTENQTVAWFKDKANTKDVTMFKAMMQETVE